MHPIQLKYLVAFILFYGSKSLYSQQVADVFKSPSLVYYGLDFTEARLIGDFGLGGTSALKFKMPVSWNEIIAQDKRKFDLRKTFKKAKVSYDLIPVTLQNEKINENKFHYLDLDYKLNPDIIPTMVAQYPIGEIKEGLGVVFIVDSFDKNKEKAFVYITFFDIATKKVYFSEPAKGTPGGIGLRNYWAGAISRMLISIKNNKFDNWENKYLN